MANPDSKLPILRALFIVMAGCWIFAPALHGDWLMDDDLYLTQNALLGDPARLWKIWFAPGSLIEYYPIEAGLQAIQWQLWHFDTTGYHLTNLALHLLGALLVWRLLAKFGLRLAWLGGLLFAIHPVVVESVAWIAEFKNVLSLPPFLLAMCAWIDYQQRGRRQDYVLSLALFLIAMLCKISMALFPLVILLYAWWKRGRIGWRDLKSAAPFLAVSLVLGITTILAGDWFRQAHDQSGPPNAIGGLFARLALAGLSFAFYLGKFLWPVGLLPIYPKWNIDPPTLVQFLPWPILIGAIGWFWVKRESWGRHALLGLGFFLINLVPFVGLNSVSYMTISWVMDHFLYLPIIGLIGLAIAILERIETGLSESGRVISAVTIAVIMGLLAWGSHSYAEMFTGQERLWTYTVQRNPGAWLAYNNLGNIEFETGRIPDAIEHYRMALRANPNVVEAHNNLGVALRLKGRSEEAVAQFEAALKINPHFAMAQVNLADTLSASGRTAEAIAHYEKALEINPTDAATRDKLAKLQAPENASPATR